MNLLEQFLRFEQLLVAHRHYWQLRPYHIFEYPWRDINSALADFLDALDVSTIDHLDGDFYELSQALSEFIPSSNELYELCQLPRAQTRKLDCPHWLGRKIPGRKWRQIAAFAASLEEATGPWLDWCSGKGHLGRLLTHLSGSSTLCVERNPELCRQGQNLAKEAPLKFHCADVLTADCSDLLRPEQHAVALHACGNLHLNLMRWGAERSLRALSMAPCCYHLIAEPIYQPLSRTAGNTALRLDRQDLQLVGQELVTSGQRMHRLRENEVLWRLGFDSLQRDLTGRDEYMPVPNVRHSVLNQDFKTFCQWAAARKGLSLPSAPDWAHYQACGHRRRGLVRRISLVRHLFRRPLEIWLLLDRALFLAEQGYRVSLQEFCPRTDTPRNILLQARC